MKILIKKIKKISKGAPSGLVVSLALHAVAFLLAGMLVVFNVVKKEEKQFIPPKPVERPKMNLKKPRVKIKKSSKPKPTTRIVTKVQKSSMPDIQLPEMSGVGEGLVGSIGGFEMLPDLSEVSSFGSEQSIGNDFVGTFYDFQRDSSGRDIGITEEDFIADLVKFVKSGWRSSKLRETHSSPKKLFATCMMVPPIRSTSAPAAFGEPDTGGYCWIVHYEGQLVHKEGITFRFWGQGDDILMVRVDDKEVLLANWTGEWNQIADEAFTQFWSSSSADSRKYILGNNLGVVGDWITLEPGVPLDMEVVIGEMGGGSYCSMLAVEVKGVEYEKGPQGNPILPMFKTTQPSHAQLDAIYKDLVPGVVCLTNGPVFSDYDTSEWTNDQDLSDTDLVKATIPDDKEMRIWTGVDGKTMQAKFVAVIGDKVTLSNAKGKNRKIPLGQLSDADRTFIELTQTPKFKIDFSKKSSQTLGKKSPFNESVPPKVLDYVFGAKLNQTSSGSYNHELHVEFFAIGTEITGDRYVLLDRQESRFTPTKENERYHAFSGKPVRLTSFEINESTRGIKYSQYLITLTDSRGKMIAHAAQNKWLLENLEALKRLPIGAYMDKTCTRVFPTSPKRPY